MAMMTPTQITEETRDFFRGVLDQQDQATVRHDLINQQLSAQNLLPSEAGTSLLTAASDFDRAIDSYSPGTTGTTGMSMDSFTRSVGRCTAVDPEVIIETTDSKGDKKTVSLNEFYQEFSDLKQRNEELESRVYKLEEHIRFLTEI